MESLILPTEPLFLLKRLYESGYEAALVGGAVRDLLRNQVEDSTQEASDFDIATNALPEEIQAVFPDSFYENSFGTVSIMHADVQKLAPIEKTAEATKPKGSRIIDVASATKLHPSLQQAVDSYREPETPEPPFEITTYRSDGNYTDFRRPSEVHWGKTLSEDLERRDFTINALALVISKEWLANAFLSSPFPKTISVPADFVTLIDNHNGQQDLNNKIIHTVGDAHTRFNEDALRMLRAIRFSVQLNYTISEETFEAMKVNHELLSHVSAERIRDELFKMLSSEYPREAISLLDQAHLLQFVLPELLDAKGIAQGGHHTTDVWTHSLDALAECPNPDPVVRLATLLHDIGKPVTFKLLNGQPTFYNHEVVGAHMAKKIGKRLRLSLKQIDRLFLLVRYHMFYYQPENSDASIRRFMRNVGLQNIDDILDLREADRLGSGARKTSWRLEEMKQRMIEQLHQPMDVTDLAINGTDLMEACQLSPGKIIGDTLEYLFEQVMNDPDKNTRTTLVELATDYLKKRPKD